MLNLIILILGDLAISVLQGFYMGVGIRQSAGWINILGMTLPTLFVWLIFSWLLGIYQWVAGLELIIPTENASSRNQPKRGRRHFFLRMLEETLGVQRIARLALVWISSSLFSVFWQTWYWNNILRVDRGISLRFTLFFCLAGFYFLVVWRAAWTAFVLVRALARQRRVIRVLCYLATAAVILYQLPALWLSLKYSDRQYTLNDELPSGYRTAIVYGAGVYRNGTASSVLRDRVNAAVQLYQAGQVDQIIMSGDNGAESRHETDVMTRVAVAAGVPAAAIAQDETGLNTQLTCENAAETYGVRQAVLVTQSFHTTRAMYSCDQYEIDSIAVSADLSVYNIFSWILWQLRDWLGLSIAWLNFTF